MICKKCGANIPDGSAICNYCGEVQGETTLISEQPTQGTPPKNEKGKNQAVASMILGIVTVSLSILGTCCGQGASVFFAFIFLAASIVGLVLASSAKKKGYVGGMATAGRVLNIIGLIVSILLTIYVFVLLGMLGIAAVVNGADILSEFMESL